MNASDGDVPRPVGHGRASRSIRVQIDGHCCHVDEAGDRTSIYYGDTPFLVTGEADDASNLDGIRVTIIADSRGVSSFIAKRGLTTSSELYYVRDGSGNIRLTNQFSRALRTLEPSMRTVDADTAVEHMLFRTIPGDRSYVREVNRLGHGQTVSWDRVSDAFHVSTPERLDCSQPHSRVSADEWLRLISDALEGFLSRIVPQQGPETANLLTGGVDSTLVQSYLPQVEAVQGAIDSAAFAPEVAYARRAASLFSGRHSVLTIREAEFYSELTRAIETLGMPPHHLQTVLLDVAFRSGHASYITAQLADALFGLPLAAVAARASAVDRFVPRLPWSRVSGNAVARKLATAGHIAAAVEKVPTRMGSIAARYATYANGEDMEAMFGIEATRRAIERRANYVLDRTAGMLFDGAGLAANLELGQTVDFMTDDAVSIWRQLANSRGLALYAPFTNSAVVRASFATASPERYVKRFRTKHSLKSLLSRRLPQYPANQRKLASGLPFEQYYSNGPLRCIWEEYEVPEFVPPSLRDAHGRPHVSVAWSAITYAVWRARVLSSSRAESQSHVDRTWTV